MSNKIETREHFVLALFPNVYKITLLLIDYSTTISAAMLLLRIQQEIGDNRVCHRCADREKSFDKR